MSKHQLRCIFAAIVYCIFALYLYWPYFEKFGRFEFLPPLNLCLAAMGGFVLSRRWIGSFAGSFFAGAIYGFGPFMLSLAKFHPLAGLLAASVPWLLCPAAYLARSSKRYRSWLSVPLLVIPFAAVLIFFQTSAHYRLFAVPMQSRLHFGDLAGLVSPLVMATRPLAIIGFYHIAIAPLVLGFVMLISARRLSIIVIMSIATVLAFCPSLFQVSPVIWFCITAMYCSILVGLGMQALFTAGYTDRKWALLAAIIEGTLAVVTLFLATKYFQTFLGLGTGTAKLLAESAKMYILGAAAVGIIFFLARARLRITYLRWAVLCSAMAVDIFFGARFIVGGIL